LDSLLPPLVGTFLAEWGDRTQFLVILLAARFGGSARMLAGIAAAAILNSLLAAFGGKLIAEIINFQAITLMMAIALLFAAAGGFWPQTAPKLAGAGTAHAMWISFFAFGVLEFGDKSQFLTATLAARSQSWWLAGLGAGAGWAHAIGVAMSAANARATHRQRGAPRTARSRACELSCLP